MVGTVPRGWTFNGHLHRGSVSSQSSIERQLRSNLNRGIGPGHSVERVWMWQWSRASVGSLYGVGHPIETKMYLKAAIGVTVWISNEGVL